MIQDGIGCIDYQSLSVENNFSTCISFLFAACLQGNSTMWMSFLLSSLSETQLPYMTPGSSTLQAKILHIHVFSGFNSKTTALSKRYCILQDEIIIGQASNMFSDEDIRVSFASLHVGGLHSSEQQVTCEIEFPFPCCQFWSLTFGWTLAATREGLNRCKEWDQNKTNQRIKHRHWSGQEHSPNQNTIWSFQNIPECFWQHDICSCFDPIT